MEMTDLDRGQESMLDLPLEIKTERIDPGDEAQMKSVIKSEEFQSHIDHDQKASWNSQTGELWEDKPITNEMSALETGEMIFKSEPFETKEETKVCPVVKTEVIPAVGSQDTGTLSSEELSQVFPAALNPVVTGVYSLAPGMDCQTNLHVQEQSSLYENCSGLSSKTESICDPCGNNLLANDTCYESHENHGPVGQQKSPDLGQESKAIICAVADPISLASDTCLDSVENSCLDSVNNSLLPGKHYPESVNNLALPENRYQESVNNTALLDNSYPESVNNSALLDNSYPGSVNNSALPDNSYPESVNNSALLDNSYPESVNNSALPENSYPESVNNSALLDNSYPESVNNSALLDNSYPGSANNSALPDNSYLGSTNNSASCNNSYPESVKNSALPDNSYLGSTNNSALCNNSYPESVKNSALPDNSYPGSTNNSALSNNRYPESANNSALPVNSSLGSDNSSRLPDNNSQGCNSNSGLSTNNNTQSNDKSDRPSPAFDSNTRVSGNPSIASELVKSTSLEGCSNSSRNIFSVLMAEANQVDNTVPLDQWKQTMEHCEPGAFHVSGEDSDHEAADDIIMDIESPHIDCPAPTQIPSLPEVDLGTDTNTVDETPGLRTRARDNVFDILSSTTCDIRPAQFVVQGTSHLSHSSPQTSNLATERGARTNKLNCDGAQTNVIQRLQSLQSTTTSLKASCVEKAVQQGSLSKRKKHSVVPVKISKTSKNNCLQWYQTPQYQPVVRLNRLPTTEAVSNVSDRQPVVRLQRLGSSVGLRQKQWSLSPDLQQNMSHSSTEVLKWPPNVTPRDLHVPALKFVPVIRLRRLPNNIDVTAACLFRDTVPRKGGISSSRATGKTVQERERKSGRQKAGTGQIYNTEMTGHDWGRTDKGGAKPESVTKTPALNREAWGLKLPSRSNMDDVSHQTGGNTLAAAMNTIPSSLPGSSDAKVLAKVGGPPPRKKQKSKKKHFVPGKCDICNQVLLSPDRVASHIKRRHQGIKPHICKVCNKAFGNLTKLKAHQGILYGGRKIRCQTVNCKVCGKSLQSALFLKRHMKIKHNPSKPKEVHKCDLCEKTFTSPFSLRQHKFWHTGQRPWVCEICGKAFTFERFLKKHRITHTGIKAYSCPICQKKFTSSSTLWKHRSVHTGERPFECSHCGKKFRLKQCLDSHLIGHTGVRSFTCAICDKKFLRKRNLEEHVLIHTGERPFACSVCDRRFLSRKLLREHMYRHTGEKTTCKICNKSFAKMYWRMHMKGHRGPRPKKECPVCHKEVRCLLPHMRTHDSDREKSYACDHCDKRFVSKQSLKEHSLLRHTQVKLFGCTQCSKKFQSRIGLKLHVYTHNGQKARCKICHVTLAVSAMRLHMKLHNPSAGKSTPQDEESRLDFQVKNMLLVQD